MASLIHPTAVVDPRCELGPDVEIGPAVVVEADTVIGARCHLMAGCVVRRYTTLGQDNVLHPHAVLGGEPQDLGFNPADRTELIIGHRNTFRERVTVNRATGAGKATVIGDDNRFLAGSHAGHNAQIGSRCVFDRNAAVAGHARLADGCSLGESVGFHQFCWAGEGIRMEPLSGITQHVPPYCRVVRFNLIEGLNESALAALDETDRRQVRQAYDILFRHGLPLARAVEAMDAHAHWVGPAVRFRDFCREVLTAPKPHNRGIPTTESARAR